MLMITPLAAGGVFAQQNAGKGSVYEELNLFDEAFERIRQDAVDPVSDSKLIGAAIAGMLSGLDPHAAFMDEDQFKALQTPSAGDAIGPGLVVTIDSGQLKVISPEDGSPAARAGIRPGDVILAINKEPIYDLTLGEAEQKLRGPAGSEIQLTMRHGAEKPTDLTIKREVYQRSAVTGRLETADIGYLRIAGFDNGTSAALAGAVQDLRQQTGNKLTGLIVDLRNNPGGSFDAAVAVADAFLEKGEIVIVKGRKPASFKLISATPGDIAKGLALVVLVNSGTAREAELVAGALQDNRRAVLLGTKTFGESSIESLIPLGTGGAIRLTTARFTTPASREIQGKGLEPDLAVTPLRLARLGQGEGRREADLPGALKNPDQAAKPPGEGSAAPSATEAPAVATEDIGSASDEQLIQAIDVLRGLSVVGRRAAG